MNLCRTSGLLLLVASVTSARGAALRQPAQSLSALQTAAVPAQAIEPGQIKAEEPKGVSQQQAGGRILTLGEALALAEQYNPQITGASAQLAGSQARIESSRAYPNPDFSVMGGVQHGRPILTPGVPGVLQHYSFNQPVELPAVRRTRIEAAKYGRDGSSFGVAAVQLGVRAQVKRAFFGVLRSREEIGHALENLRLVEDLRNRTQVQVKVGEAAKLELTRAEAEVARAQTLVRSARLLYVTALSALRAAISAPLGPDVEPRGRLDDPLRLPPLDTLRTAVLHNHPAARQADAEIERASAVLKNERALRLPQPSLYAEYEEQPDLGFYRVGLSLPLPLWDRRKGPIAEAVAAVNEAKAVASQRRLELISALERAYGQYQVSDEQVESFQGGALRESEAALQAAEAAYKFGERGIMEVLDAQRVLHAVRGDLLDAQYERETALIDLEELGAVHLGK